jgi:hypothetical protein
VLPVEAQQVAHVGRAEGVDGLVVVAYHHQVRPSAGQQHQHALLQRVGVLVLVDLHVAPAPPVAGQDVGPALEQRDAEAEQVVEVQGV